MTRIANVFANAIFGALAVLFFSGALQQELKTIKLNPQQQEVVIKQANNLGNAKVPGAILPDKRSMIEKAYHQGFINAYGKIMRIAACLGFLGALMALVFIHRGRPKEG